MSGQVNNTRGTLSVSSYLERHARVLELAQWKVISTTGSSGTAKWQQILFAEWGNVGAEQCHYVVNPCPGLGVASATTIYFGMPTTSCANENGTCTFSDTATIAYGSLAVGRFTARKDQTSPVTCSNAYFGDPASGFAKACYVLSY